MPEHLLDNETRYRLLRLLAEDPTLSQRAQAKALGVSLGRVNYCLRALLDKGYVKIGSFGQSEAKRNYLYQLTPAGIAAKARAAKRFLARKQDEYRRLEAEINELYREAGL